jgi:hypothetical protein
MVDEHSWLLSRLISITRTQARKKWQLKEHLNVRDSYHQPLSIGQLLNRTLNSKTKRNLIIRLTLRVVQTTINIPNQASKLRNTMLWDKGCVIGLTKTLIKMNLKSLHRMDLNWIRNIYPTLMNRNHNMAADMKSLIVLKRHIRV